MKKSAILVSAGAAAGFVNGLFGAGGGMVLVPLLRICVPGAQVFSNSLSVILPVCVVSVILGGGVDRHTWITSLPYLIGGFAGGIIAAKTANKIPVKWLHRFLGIMILWGGVRCLC